MSKQPAIIRKKEARQSYNPQRLALLFAIFTAVSATGIGGMFLFQSTTGHTPAQVVKVEIPADTVDVVVARNTVAYNERVKPTDLKVVKWPREAKPVGAFSTVESVFSSKGPRYFMARTVENEIILPGKISEPGRQATLAALLQKNTRAVAVRVDDVLGVSGFVRPGDFVDVIMTRSTDESTTPVNFSVALLQNVHVLGVDQTSRVTSDVSDAVKRAAKTVTLEVDLVGAQKLALGNTVGKLSLALRKARATVYRNTKQIRLADLGHTSIEATTGSLQLASSVAPKANATSASATKPAAPIAPQTTTITVTRAVERTELEVTPEKLDGSSKSDED